MWKISELWLPGLIKKISLFLFLMTSVVFMTFIIGNFQEFLDSTQILLLKIFEISAGSFILTGLYHIILTFFNIINRRPNAILSMVVMVIGEVVVVSFYILTNLIFAVTRTVI